MPDTTESRPTDQPRPEYAGRLGVSVHVGGAIGRKTKIILHLGHGEVVDISSAVSRVETIHDVRDAVVHKVTMFQAILPDGEPA